MQTPSIDGNVTQTAFLQLIEEYTDVDQAVHEAVGMRKDLRKRIKGAGFSLAAFDRARKEAEKSEDMRDEEDRQFRRNMAWMGKPLGYQADWIGEPPPSAGANGPAGDEDQPTQHQVRQVEAAGLAAGRAGVDRADNPWGEGSFLSRVWDDQWLAGQQELGANILPSRRRRGRPRKEAEA
jgi:hypothetical protein